MVFRQAHAWTPAQDTAVRDRVKNGKTQLQLSKELGASVWLVSKREERLRSIRDAPAISAEGSSETQTSAPSLDNYSKMGTNRWALPPGHPTTWGAITRGTLLEGTPYPSFGQT